MTALIPHQPDATPVVYDAATLAVLHAMEEAADKHLDAIVHTGWEIPRGSNPPVPARKRSRPGRIVA